MNKKYLLILMLVLSIICVGCGDKEEVPNQVVNDTNIVDTESGEQGNSDSIEIKEENDKVVVNMYDDSTSEYIFSGDFVIEKNDIYHFESEEKANSFASSLENMDNVIIDGKNVTIKSNDSSYLNLTKKDLMNTYSTLKEEYENGKD